MRCDSLHVLFIVFNCGSNSKIFSSSFLFHADKASLQASVLADIISNPSLGFKLRLCPKDAKIWVKD